MDEARAREAVTLLTARSLPISVRTVHALTGGSFRDLTRHLRPLRAEGVLGEPAGQAAPVVNTSSCAGPWRPLALEDTRQVARRIVQEVALVYRDEPGETVYVVDDGTAPASTSHRLALVETAVVAGLMRQGRVLVSQHSEHSGRYRIPL